MGGIAFLEAIVRISDFFTQDPVSTDCFVRDEVVNTVEVFNRIHSSLLEAICDFFSRFGNVN